ncbi:MAG: S1 RNA-binding domain-containing protein [Myxococcota bacterium]
MAETTESRPDGQVILGHVHAEGPDGSKLVRLPDGTETFVPSAELGGAPVTVGEPAWVFVDQWSESKQAFLGSLDRAQKLRLLDALERAMNDDQDVEGEVVSVVEGGYSVDVGLRAFVPASQVALRTPKNPEDVLGQRLRFKVIRCQKSRANVVLSRRSILETERRSLFSQIRVGATVEGVVRDFVESGVIVDVNGVEGFLHVSDMTWGRERDSRKLVKQGERLRAKVLRVERKAHRLKLGLRQTQDDPWTDADRRFPPGSKVRGMVVSKTDFGCFIEFEPGLEGLVFSSGPLATEGARDRLRKTDIGDELDAVVVEVNLVAKRISLQLDFDA